MGFGPSVYLCVIVLALVLLWLYFKTGRPFRCVLFTLGSGLLALGIVWVIGRFTPLTVGLTPLTALVSAVLGVPGVVGMLVFGLL